MLAVRVAASFAVFPDCPGKGCLGTAWERHSAAQAAARRVDLDGPWSQVRQELVQACGLKVDRSTGHCFNDFNHVDCCTMAAGNTHRTNEESRVPGMHQINLLGPHIEAASVSARGDGGSWCTCHLSAPYDVCHKQLRSARFKHSPLLHASPAGTWLPRRPPTAPQVWRPACLQTRVVRCERGRRPRGRPWERAEQRQAGGGRGRRLGA